MTNLVARIAVLISLLGLVLASAAASPPVRTETVAASTSTSHPFSDPLYFPLHASFGVDCIRTNPGCDHDRGFWSMDIAPLGQSGPGAKPSHAAVYAMGAGILHIGEAHGDRCPAAHGSFGTWVWIDHGGGTVSRYGHLSRILVASGAHVAAGQAIGVVGTTGKGSKCERNYLDFMVEHRGMSNRHSVQMKLLRACVGSGSGYAVWPRDAPATYHDRSVRFAVWNDVRKGSEFPATNGHCVPTSSDTASRPGGLRLTRTGHRHLTLHWAAPATRSHVTAVMIEVSLYHPSTHAWDRLRAEEYITVSPRHVAREVRGLSTGRIYRMRVCFHNKVGWSRPSSWHRHSVR